MYRLTLNVAGLTGNTKTRAFKTSASQLLVITIKLSILLKGKRLFNSKKKKIFQTPHYNQKLESTIFLIMDRGLYNSRAGIHTFHEHAAVPHRTAVFLSEQLRSSAVGKAKKGLRNNDHVYR